MQKPKPMENLTKEQALQKIEELNKFIAEIDNKSNTEAAAKWLTELLPTLTAKFQDGNIVWRNKKSEYMFEQDYKNGLLRYSYDRVYLVLNSNYKLEYNKTQQLIADVVGNAFKCEQLTPPLCFSCKQLLVGNAFKCEQLTPETKKFSTFHR